MKTIRLIFLSLAAALSGLLLSAQQPSTQPVVEAFVSSVSGTATVTTPGSTESAPVVAGQKLPEGATITTGDDSSVVVQSHAGIETGITSRSTVVIGAHSVSTTGVRTAVIDLKKGATVSVLDPGKSSVNNYAVRTPKGVAAARGTIYSTTVVLAAGGEALVTVDTFSGTVSFSINGGPTIAVSAGNSASSGSTAAIPISTAYLNASEAERAQILETVKIAALVVGIVNDQAMLDGFKATIKTITDEITKTDAAFAQSINDALIVGLAAAETAEVVTTAEGNLTATASASPTTATTPPAGATAPTPDITIIVSPSS